MKPDYVGNITSESFSMLLTAPDMEKLWDSIVELSNMNSDELWGNNLRNFVDLICIFKDDPRLPQVVARHDYIVGMADRQIQYEKTHHRPGWV